MYRFRRMSDSHKKGANREKYNGIVAVRPGAGDGGGDGGDAAAAGGASCHCHRFLAPGFGRVSPRSYHALFVAL
jgi:hypothetical protein